MAVWPSRWELPHDNKPQVMVEESGDSLTLRLPMWRGGRSCFLHAGTAEQFAGNERGKYHRRFAQSAPHHMVGQFITDWPGLEDIKPRLSTIDTTNGGAMNPTGSRRGTNTAALKDVAKPGGLGTLSMAQWILHPYTYGSYWDGWSSENPNFFTDFIKAGILMTARLKDDPRFEELRSLAEAKFREDVYHAVTMPGGAGQECPGYLQLALAQWIAMAPACIEHLGFDPLQWPPIIAAVDFLCRSGPPAGDSYDFHPAGDTHPDRPNPFTYFADLGFTPPAIDSLKSQDFPGFGPIFRGQRAGG